LGLTIILDYDYMYVYMLTMLILALCLWSKKKLWKNIGLMSGN